MKRVLVGIVVSILAVGLSASGAEAEKKKKAKKKDAAPASAQIAESMGDLKWGMTRTRSWRSSSASSATSTAR